MNTKLLIIFFCLSQSLWLYGQLLTPQSDSTIDQDAIERDRYKEDIKGSPYLFDQWTKATVIDARGYSFQDISVNYNGYEKMFEAMQGDSIVGLENVSFLKVILPGEMDLYFSKELRDADIIFQNRIHPKFGNQFVQILYDGRRVKLLREYYKDLSKHTVQNVGKAVTFQRFTHRELTHLLIDGEISLIKLKKKQFLSKLGKVRKMEEFAKKENLKFDSLKDYQKALNYYETLL